MEAVKPPSQDQDFVGKSLEVTIKVGLVIGLIAWCFMILQPFFMIVLWSIILAVAIYPLFRGIRNKLKLGKIPAAILVTVFLLMLILIPIILLGGSLGDAIAYVRDALISGKSMIPPPSESVKSWPVIGKQLFVLWQRSSENLANVAIEYKSQLMTGLSWFLTALTNAGVGLLIILGSIIISGVMLVFTDQSADATRNIAVRLMGERGIETVANAEVTIRNVARGILGVAFIQAFLAGIGFLVAGIPGAGLWALIGFLLAIVQIGVGPVIIGVLIYAYIKLSMMTAILLTLWCIIPMVIDNVLKPILLGRKAPAPMLVVFLGAIGGFISFGIIGLFVGAVVLSLGYDLFRIWVKNDNVKNSAAQQDEPVNK
jgi:predicted PurR-regulated permease PerM